MSTRVLFYFAVALTVFSVAAGTAAQNKVARATQSLELQALSDTLKIRDAAIAMVLAAVLLVGILTEYR
jgi:hypothetical protein